MRTVQRLRHQLVPRPQERWHIERGEDWAIRRKQWFLRAERLRLLASALAFGAAIAGIAWGLGRARLVLPGLVQADVVLVRAPAAVRVAETYVQAGSRVRQGEPLFRLEALDEGALALLRLQVERKRRSLELARLGEDLGVSELGRRLELLWQAELESASSAAQIEVSDARRDALRGDRTIVALDLRDALVRSDGEVLARASALRDAELRLAAVLDGSRLAAFDAQASSTLHSEGLATSRSELEADVRRRGSQGEIERAQEACSAAQASLTSALHSRELAARRLEASLAEAQASMRTVEAEAQGARRRKELWQRLLERRRGLLPDPLPDPVVLREAQIALLETELEEAQVALGLEEERRGKRVLIAPCDGIVDCIEVEPGAAVEAQSVLLRAFDPRTLRVVAFASARQAFEVEAGNRCSVVLAGAEVELEGRVASLGASLQPLPAPLAAQGDEGTADGAQVFRLPLFIEHEGESPHLRPNALVKIVVERGS